MVNIRPVLGTGSPGWHGTQGSLALEQAYIYVVGCIYPNVLLPIPIHGIWLYRFTLTSSFCFVLIFFELMIKPTVNHHLLQLLMLEVSIVVTLLNHLLEKCLLRASALSLVLSCFISVD